MRPKSLSGVLAALALAALGCTLTENNNYNLPSASSGVPQASPSPGGDGGADEGCASIIGGATAEVVGGTVQGGKGQVGEPVLVEVSATAIGGGGLPAVCQDLAVTAESTTPATCSPLSFTTLRNLGKVEPTAPGLCNVDIEVAGKRTSVSFDVVP